MKKYLIIGGSHVHCISAALKDRPELDLDIVHMKNERYKKFGDENLRPDVVCLSIAGNTHNFLTIFENPVPFTTGGLQLDDQNRVSIPSALIGALLKHKLSEVPNTAKMLHDMFPDAAFVYICAPPPVFAVGKIARVPKGLERLADCGFAPNALRMHVYGLQVDFYRALAKSNGAGFLSPPAAALTEDGLLAPSYTYKDPTHATKKYGILVLDQILEWGEAQS